MVSSALSPPKKPSFKFIGLPSSLSIGLPASALSRSIGGPRSASANNASSSELKPKDSSVSKSVGERFGSVFVVAVVREGGLVVVNAG